MMGTTGNLDWKCGFVMKPQTTTMEIDIRKMSVGGSLHCSIEEESVITFVAITTAVRLTSSYLQHQCAPSHTSTATGITLIPDTMKRAPQCQLNALRPDRGGGPDRVGEDSETGNRLKGSDVCLRHMLSLLFFFFPQKFSFSFLVTHAREPGLDRKLLCGWRRPSTLRH